MEFRAESSQDQNTVFEALVAQTLNGASYGGGGVHDFLHLSSPKKRMRKEQKSD